jgi:hypothetical protein
MLPPSHFLKIYFNIVVLSIRVGLVFTLTVYSLVFSTSLTLISLHFAQAVYLCVIHKTNRRYFPVQQSRVGLYNVTVCVICKVRNETVCTQTSRD